MIMYRYVSIRPTFHIAQVPSQPHLRSMMVVPTLDEGIYELAFASHDLLGSGVTSEKFPNFI